MAAMQLLSLRYDRAIADTDFGSQRLKAFQM